jgi:hypothetical protein
VVYLDVTETPSTDAPPKIAHSIRDALCIPLQKIHELYANRFKGGSVTLDRDLAPRPRVLRILVIDDGLPPPLDMFSSPVDIGEDMSKLRSSGPNWKAILKQNCAHK